MAIVMILVVGLGVIAGLILTRVSQNDDVTLDRTIDDKVRELPPIFKKARASVRIATDFDERFFGRQEVKDSLEQAVINGAKVMFLSEAKPISWYEGREGIEIKRVQKLEHHVMVVDGRHTRLERPHKPSSFGKGKGDVALIFKNFPELGTTYNEEFHSLWTTLS